MYYLPTMNGQEVNKKTFFDMWSTAAPQQLTDNNRANSLFCLACMQTKPIVAFFRSGAPQWAKISIRAHAIQGVSATAKNLFVKALTHTHV